MAYVPGSDKKPESVSLIAVSVGDDGHPVLDELLTIAAQRESLPEISGATIAKSVARVELADEKSVSDTKPAWRAAIEIEFDERDPGRGAAGGSPIHVYEFKLDLGI